MQERLNEREGRPLRRRTLPLAFVTFVALAASGGFALPSADAQGIEPGLQAVAERLAKARAENLDIFAPRHFERAERRLEEAKRLRSGGEDSGRIRDLLAEARKELEAAGRVREGGRLLLRDALRARESAASAHAPEYAPGPWQKAERTIREAGRRLESEDRSGARERAGRAEREFRAAELEAVRAEVLGPAEEARKRARSARADRLAPTTFGGADSLLHTADAAFQEGASPGDRARAAALEAQRGFDRAARLAARADSLDRGTLTSEAILLRDRQHLERVSEALGLDVPAEAEGDAIAERLAAAARALREQLSSLQDELRSRTEQNRRLTGRIDSLESRLTELERREAEAAAAARRSEERERRLREARAVFTPEEAEVLLADGRLVIRLRGLTFESGSNEIRPENQALLKKVEAVIREFPGARVTIEGHTDSVGDAAANQALSQRRAIAVRDYLLANMPISADRIEAVGYGESRPIASNETEEGRRRNRRIEVSLTLPE